MAAAARCSGARRRAPRPCRLALSLLALLCCAPRCGGHALHARAARCRLGSEPGRWVRARWDVERPGRGLLPYYNRLDGSANASWLTAAVEPADTPFGSAWRALNPACAHENLLQPFLGQRFVRNVTLLLLGDSVDTQLLDFACGEAAARNLTGWAAFVHSHSVVNYCSLPSGLHLVQMYLQRYSRDDDARRLAAAARFLRGDDAEAYDKHEERGGRDVLRNRDVEARAIADATPDGRPALVVYSAAHYWVLLAIASRHNASAPPDVLTEAEVESYMNTTGDMLGAVAAALPRARLAVHTSPEVRAGCEDGVQSIASEKMWARRPYVATLNAAMRALAARRRLPVLDMEQMGAAFTPAQLLIDLLHPRAWFQVEVLNLYLNMAAGGARGGKAEEDSG